MESILKINLFLHGCIEYHAYTAEIKNQGYVFVNYKTFQKIQGLGQFFNVNTYKTKVLLYSNNVLAIVLKRV